MFNFNELEYLQLEVTNNCQARCPMCPRITEGKDNPNLVVSSWTLDEYKQIVDKDVIAQVKVIEFCGNYGDPVLNRELLEMCEYTRSNSNTVKIIIKTNGGIRNQDWWSKLAKVLNANDTVVFAIDGLSDTNHLYRVGTDFDKILENAKAFINNGGSAIWEMLLFSHNEHQVDEARELSETMGFRVFSPKISSRFIETESGPMFTVKDKEGNNLYDLKPYSKNEIQFISKDLLKNYKSLVEQCDIDCKVKRTKEVYIDGHKHVYPCIFTGKVLYDTHEGDLLTAKIMSDSFYQFKELIENIGGLDKLSAFHGLRNIIDSELWQTLWINKWQNPDKLIVCAKACHTQNKHYVDRFLDA